MRPIWLENSNSGACGSASASTERAERDAGLRIRTMRLPDVFQDHDSPERQYDAAGLNAPQIVETVLKALRHNSAGVEEARA